MTPRRGKKSNAKPVAAPTTPPGEHIFPSAQLTPLAVKWKQLNAAKRHKEAMDVLGQIIEGSTAMFERLAQYEEFHYMVDLPILVAAAQEKVVKWLLRWSPKKGRLFSWFSKCAKNAFRSELSKVSQYRKKFHVTGDDLEKFHGVEDHAVNKHDAAAEARSRLRGITCRWGDPQEIGALRFLIDCIVADDHNRQAAIRSASYAFGIAEDHTKFFYNWALQALRNAFYDLAYFPFTEQDLLRAAYAYTILPDLIDLIGYENTKKLIAVYGGTRMKIPSLASLAELKRNYQMYREIQSSDQDPDSVTAIARKYRRNQRTATEVYNDMVDVLDPNRSGEHELYDHDNEPNP
jgi:hypothetical protein